MSKLVLIDRDGTIIIGQHYLSSPDQIELLPNAAAGIALLRSLGFRVVVVTNQSAIGRDIISIEALGEIHRRLRQVLRRESTEVDAIYFCPHLPDDGCKCRKPSIGMAERAALEHNISLSECFVIGDNVCDIELGKNISATTILVRTGYGKKVEKEKETQPDYVVDTLFDAAHLIEEIVKKGGANAKYSEA